MTYYGSLKGEKAMPTMKKSAPTAAKGKKSVKARADRKRHSPGESDKLRARPRGSRNRATLRAESMLEDFAETVMSKIRDAANEGDRWALTWLGDRIVAPRRSQPVVFDMPPTERVEDFPAAHDSLLEEVAGGKIDLKEARGISGLYEAKRKAIETEELVDEMEAFKLHLKNKR